MAPELLCFADFLPCTGVLPGPEGFELETLERFAQVRGWTWTTSPTTALQDPPGEWTASIFAPSTAVGLGVSTVQVSRGTGRSEPEALATALTRKE